MPKKNKYGQYFTIDVIADFMVSLIGKQKSCSILEPSCGKGVFLDKLANRGFNNLSAYEIDESLSTEYNFVQHKSFLSVPTSEKFDVVIGNPPYIRWKNLEPELREELEHNPLWNRYFNSLCDYLFIFILKSIEHLNEGGELIFICTDYWMNTTHSMALRNYMCANGYFNEIYHFKETPLFEKVTASFVVFKYIKTSIRNNTINLYNYTKEKGLPTIEELLNKSCFNLVNIPHFKENSRWILATQETQERLLSFETACYKNESLISDGRTYKIGDYCDIGNGMVSGLDAAFQIGNINELNSNEKQAIIAVLKAKNLQAYKNVGKTHYIFLQEQMSEESFALKYPHFASHFMPFLDKLHKRYSYNRNIPYWEFVFPRNQKLFERDEDRIFIPCKERISNKKFFRFCYAPRGYYPTQDVTAILKKPSCKESIEYILAYLNNKRVFEWLIYNGIVKGDIVEFSEAPIASIPFRPIDWKNTKEVSIHDHITKEVRAFLNDNLKEHLMNIENLLNTLLYE